MRRILLITLVPLFASLLAGSLQADNSTVIGPDPLLQAGARALQLRDFAEGVRLTQQGLMAEVAPRARVTGLSNLCAGYVGLGQYARAIEHCDAALALRPRFWRALNNRALALLGQQKLHAALLDAQRGLEINPEGGALRRSLELIRAAQARESLTAAVSTITE